MIHFSGPLLRQSCVHDPSRRALVFGSCRACAGHSAEPPGAEGLTFKCHPLQLPNTQMDLGKSYEDISKGFQELLTPRHQGPPEPDGDTQNGHLPGYACPSPGSDNPASRTGSSFATGRKMQRCISDTNVARLLQQEAGGRVELLGKRHPAVCRPPLCTLLTCARAPVVRSERTFFV